MKVILIALGLLFILIGAVWILQGINILPGSFMTGQIQWAYAGIVAVIIGGAFVWLAFRRNPGGR